MRLTLVPGWAHGGLVRGLDDGEEPLADGISGIVFFQDAEGIVPQVAATLGLPVAGLFPPPGSYSSRPLGELRPP